MAMPCLATATATGIASVSQRLDQGPVASSVSQRAGKGGKILRRVIRGVTVLGTLHGKFFEAQCMRCESFVFVWDIVAA